MSSLTPRIDKLERNAIINGNFDFWQRAISVNGTGLSADAYVGADRIKTSWNFAGGGHSFDFVRSTDVPTFAESGFQSVYSWSLTSNNSRTFPAGLDYWQPFIYKVEGRDFLGFYGRDVTFSFWFKASVTGTYNFTLQNPAASRIYVSEFTVSVSNVWQFVSVTINMETVSWNFNNTAALNIYIAPLANVALQTSTLNTWGNLSGLVSTTATNYLATAGAVIKVAQLSMVSASVFSEKGFCRAGRTIAEELLLCQRYFEKSYPIDSVLGSSVSSGQWFGYVTDIGAVTSRFGLNLHFKTRKRAVPTMIYYNWRAAFGLNQISRYNADDNQTHNGGVGTSTPSEVDVTGYLDCTGNISSSTLWGTHWAADAEL